MLSKSKNFKKILSILLFLTVILTIVCIPVNANQATDREVILGGSLFGVKMQTKGIPIVSVDSVQTTNGTTSPAYDAGLKPKDIILKINGQAVSTVKQVLNLIEGCKGSPLTLTVLRGDETKELSLSPISASDGKYRAGIWIRDSAAGIGTVTYIDPKTGEFAGLGHGICDSDTAALLPLSRGIVTEVELSSIVKGENGAPGEIHGAFKGEKIGSLVKNTSKGVYGIYSTLPIGITRKIKVASFDEITEGKARIISAVSGELKEYQIEITKISKGTDGKNFNIKVIDPELIALTGGIVQGMSGSPIIQNGKLIGAVTHVTVKDPTVGYGIYIENMLLN